MNKSRAGEVKVRPTSGRALAAHINFRFNAFFSIGVPAGKPAIRHWRHQKRCNGNNSVSTTCIQSARNRAWRWLIGPHRVEPCQAIHPRLEGRWGSASSEISSHFLKKKLANSDRKKEEGEAEEIDGKRFNQILKGIEGYLPNVSSG